MIASEDFTSIPAGTEVLLEGFVAVCPRCGRNGVEHRPVRAASYFVHRQSTELLPDGLRIDLDDVCACVEAAEARPA